MVLVVLLGRRRPDAAHAPVDQRLAGRRHGADRRRRAAVAFGGLAEPSTTRIVPAPAAAATDPLLAGCPSRGVPRVALDERPEPRPHRPGDGPAVPRGLRRRDRQHRRPRRSAGRGSRGAGRRRRRDTWSAPATSSTATSTCTTGSGRPTACRDAVDLATTNRPAPPPVSTTRRGGADDHTRLARAHAADAGEIGWWVVAIVVGGGALVVALSVAGVHIRLRSPVTGRRRAATLDALVLVAGCSWSPAASTGQASVQRLTPTTGEPATTTAPQASTTSTTMPAAQQEREVNDWQTASYRPEPSGDGPPVAALHEPGTLRRGGRDHARVRPRATPRPESSTASRSSWPRNRPPAVR